VFTLTVTPEPEPEPTAITYSLAEGATGVFFDTDILLANPNSSPAPVVITFLKENGTTVTDERTLPAMSRTTIRVDHVKDLEATALSTQVVSTSGLPLIVERTMRWDAAGYGSHTEKATAGATAPSTNWFLAEGATGGFFTTFVLLANPGTEAADVTSTYLPVSGEPIVRTRRLEAGQRTTINIAGEDSRLASAAVATRVESTRPIIAERAQYWPNPAWHEAHNSFGVTETATRWGLAEGRVGGASGDQTYILLANSGATAASVKLTFLRTDGTTIEKTFTVPATSRVNVAVAGPGSDVPELDDEAFGTIIESTEPIVVERSMYSNVGNVIWAAGSNATATRLP
jgi:hypothetical protein